MHRTRSFVGVAALTVLLASCGVATGTTGCSGSTPTYRWTFTNLLVDGETPEDEIIDSVTLTPDETAAGPHGWVGLTIPAGSAITHLDYTGSRSNLSETLTVTWHRASAPATLVSTSPATATWACP